MPKKERLKRAANGLYFRNLGYRKTPKGYSQPKFYLGRDERQAEIANRMLERLWDAVKRRWKAQTLPTPKCKETGSQQLLETSGEMSSTAAAVATVGVAEVEYVREGKPTWDEISLCVADAIRGGEAIVRVPVPDELAPFGLQSPSVGHWLDQLRRDFCDLPVHIELLNEERQEEAETQIREEGTRLIEEGRRMVRQRAGGETLYAAFREYEKALEKKHRGLDGKVTPTGTTQVRQVAFLRETFPDCDLSELDTPKILLFQDTLAMRPRGKKVDRIAARSARNFIKQFRHFIRWLNMERGFKWKRPSDLEFRPVRIETTAEEKSAVARKPRVQTYTVDEIGVLWEYASPLRRLLLLLGLNCGFDAKMIATLHPDDVYLHQNGHQIPKGRQRWSARRRG